MPCRVGKGGESARKSRDRSESLPVANVNKKEMADSKCKNVNKNP